mgnify:CR=1 FL=1
MQKKRTGRMLCSLALSAVTLWGVSVTAPAKDARDALRTLKDETLGVMLLRYERGDGGEDFLSLRTSLALHATPLLREGEENIAQAWSAELEQKPDDSADETGDAQDSEGTVLTQEETPDEIAVTENGSPARTLKASDPSGYTVFGNVYINNGSDAALDASMLSGDYAAKLGAEGPQVLIIHTHGSESYTMPPGQEYDVSDTFRTLDTNCNMIRIGDWIQMDKNNANGVVLEVNLYTVKVQNWDMTISMVPTYQLVSESFTNWRGMQESPGRRIMRSINIDIDSVHFLSHDEVVKFASSAFLKDYIDQMVAKLGDINKDKITILDERKLTNIGIFRYYMDAWIEANPDINTNMTHMVRQLQPGPTGMPIQIYCFSAIQEWVTYEKVQADIFDHIMAVLPEFGLKVFEYKSMYVGGENQS